MEEHDVKLHEDITAIKTELKQIKENHLVHIYQWLEKLDDRLWYILTTIVVSTLLGIGVSIWVK